MQHLEELFPGPRYPRPQRQGTCTIMEPPRSPMGRGSVLTIDLTNRCNMMWRSLLSWTPNQGRVCSRAELGRHQDHARQRGADQAPSPDGACSSRAASRRCRRTFLDAIAYARKVGLQLGAGGHQRHRVRQEARNCAAPRRKLVCAIAYLQFDGIGNAANSHRKVGNLFDVKLQAIHNLHEGWR